MDWTSVADEPAQRGGQATGLGAYLAIAGLLLLILAFTVVASGRAFAFADVGADTFFQYYPLQIAVARQLHALHDMTWSFELGLGGYLGGMFDPLWLATGWLPESWQLSLRLPIFLLRTLAAGGFFHAYLRQLGVARPIAVLGGLGFAFGSYAMINAQWDLSHGAEFVQFAALLYLLESHLLAHRSGQPRRRFALAAGIVLGLGHPFALYMFSLFALVYLGARLWLLPPGARRPMLAGLPAFAAWSIAGLAITAPLLFPAIYYFLDSPRVGGEHSQLHELLGTWFTLNERAVVASEFAGIVGKDLLGTGSKYTGWLNYFEAPGFYVGLLPLLCIPQLAGPHAGWRERRLLLATLLGTGLYFAWPALRHAVYGFGHFAFRFSTLWIAALLLVAGLLGLRRALASGWWKPGLLLGGGAIVATMLVPPLLHSGVLVFEVVARAIAFVLLYAGIALIATAAALPGRLTACVLVAIASCELLVFALPAVLERDAVRSDGTSSAGTYADDDTLKALQWIRDNEHDSQFYRIEKTYSSVFLNDALVQDYPGTASYFFHGAAITRFVDRLHLPRTVPYTNWISSMAPRPKVLDLLAVRFVLTKQRSLDGKPGMRYLVSMGKVDVYRNDNAHAFATVYAATRSEAFADSLDDEKRDRLLLDAIVLDDAAGAAQSALPPAAAVAPSDRGAAAAASPSAPRPADIARVREDQLIGSATAASAGLLLLAMPFDRGWHAWVDGAPAELLRADYGLTAMRLPAGHHEFILSYRPVGRGAGFAALIGMLAFLAVFTRWPRRLRRGPAAGADGGDGAPAPGRR